MGVGSSSRLQKQLFPRSKTKLEAMQDKLTGHNMSYPSVPASSQHVKVDPDYTPQYSNLLKNVAGNVRSANDNFKFRDFSMNDPVTEEKASLTPTGYLDRDSLTRMFITEKETPNLHERFGLTPEELDKIFSCYTGYKMKRNTNEASDFVKEVIKERNEPPHKIVMTGQFASQVVNEHEITRLKKESRSGGSIDLDQEVETK